MGWVLLALLVVLGLPVALLVVLGLPVALLLLGFALAIWATLAVAGLVWGVVTFAFGSPVLGMVLALAVGRAMARRPKGGLPRALP